MKYSDTIDAAVALLTADGVDLDSASNDFSSDISEPQAVSFVFFKSFSDAMRELGAKNQLKLFWAINDYAIYGREPDFKGCMKALWISLVYIIDRNKKRYDASVRNGRKGAEYGKRGGRPKKNSSPETPKIPLNDNVDVDDNVNDNKAIIESDKSDSLSTPGVDMAAANEKIVSPSRNSMIDYVELANFFNSTLDSENSTIPHVQKITGRRRSLVEARCREYGREAVFLAITLAAKSDFLNGRSNTGWRTNFDWIFATSNFPKVIEGNYQNSYTSNTSSHENNQDDRFSARRGTQSSAKSYKDFPRTL